MDRTQWRVRIDFRLHRNYIHNSVACGNFFSMRFECDDVRARVCVCVRARACVRVFFYVFARALRQGCRCEYHRA
jgi:hypothetical protein